MSQITHEESLAAARQHQFDQAKAQREIVRELKELNANLRSMIEILTQPKQKPRKRRGE